MKKVLLKTSNNTSGFSLVELMVVISIIAILSAIGMVIYTNTQKTARDTKRIADINNVAKALEMYYTQNGSVYPGNPSTAITEISTLLTVYFSGGVMPKDARETTGWDYNKSYTYGAYDSSSSVHTYSPMYTVCAIPENCSNKCNSSTRGSITTSGTLLYYCVSNQQ